MPTLYVTEPGAVLRRRAGSLVVTVDRDSAPADPDRDKPSATLLEVEPHRLEMIGLVGHVHITAEATRLCLDKGIAVAWLSRNGDLLGRLVPELSRTADLRLQQFRTFDDDAAALAIGRSAIAAKIGNAAAFLTALRSNRPGEPRFPETIAHLHRLRGQIARTPTRETLLGLEGEAARRYFSVLGLAFSGEIGFENRHRRPPPDPANALLSLGYVLLINLIAGLLEARGLDPYLGFLHTRRSGRPSLALDMAEEFRHPAVDRLVLRLCNRKQMRLDCFETDPARPGVRLTRDGLKRFFREWEASLDAPMAGLADKTTVERALTRQVDGLAAHLRGQDTYRPLLLRNAE